MSQDQLEVMEELEQEIDSCKDAKEKKTLERTLKVCREFAYLMAEGIILTTKRGKELYFTKA